MLPSIFSVVDIILRTSVVYVLILAGLRLAGKRELGQMAVFDLVLLLLIANAVQNAMLGPDTSLGGGLLAALILLSLNGGLARLLVRLPKLRSWVEGSPTLLVEQGKPNLENLRSEGLDEETLEAALRQHGIADLDQVELAVLETDGSISIIPTQMTTHGVKHPMKFMRRQV